MAEIFKKYRFLFAILFHIPILLSTPNSTLSMDLNLDLISEESTLSPPIISIASRQIKPKMLCKIPSSESVT